MSQQTTSSFYETVYNRLYRFGYHIKPGYSHSRPLLEALLAWAPFESALDIGCSKGWAIKWLMDRGKRAAGVDVSSVAVHAARRKGLDAQQACATNLPYPDGAFDIVFSTDCFEHLRPEDVGPAVSEAWRVANQAVALKVNPRADRDKFWRFVARTPLHLTLMPVQAWIRRFEQLGGELVHNDEQEEFFIIRKPDHDRR